MSVSGCSQLALRVARGLHQAVQPEIAILFGSRARGDYDGGSSDIDIWSLRRPGPPRKKSRRAAG